MILSSLPGRPIKLSAEQQPVEWVPLDRMFLTLAMLNFCSWECLATLDRIGTFAAATALLKHYQMAERILKGLP